MSQTSEVKEYCDKHNGKLFDLGYLSKTIFRDIPLANLRKYVTRLVEQKVLRQLSKGIFVIGETDLPDVDFIIYHYLIDVGITPYGIPAKEYLLQKLDLTDKENVPITIYTRKSFSNKNICGVNIIAYPNSLFFDSYFLAILLELIHCETLVEEEFKALWVVKLHEYAKYYNDNTFSQFELTYPRYVYLRLANLLDLMHISNRVMEIYDNKKEI